MSNTRSLKDWAHDVNAKLDAQQNANHCGAGLLRLQQSQVEFRARIQRVERLACEVESILVSWQAPSAGQAPRDLAAIAQELADRVAYLEEALKVVEQDEDQIQLRSHTPTVHDDQARLYFEGLVEAQGISLHRYRKVPGERRSIVPTVMARSLLTRLAHDLMEIASVNRESRVGRNATPSVFGS